MNIFSNRITNKVVFLLFSMLLTAPFVRAQDLKMELATKATASFYEVTGEKNAPISAIVIDAGQANEKYVFNFSNGGWIILKKEVAVYSVLAFAEKGQFVIENSPLFSTELIETIQINEQDSALILANTSFDSNSGRETEDDYIEPFLTDVWGGVNCWENENHNSYSYPSNFYTPYHCSPGCVAIASSQVLHYYEWPIKGVGNNVYADDYNGDFLRHQAFFDHTSYDWDNMLDVYMEASSSEVEQQAVGKLMYNMGVAILMNYEPSGSTNNLDNVPFALENFFRFSGHYQPESWSPFWTRVYDGIQQLRPTPIAIENSDNGEGHVMVANGYKLLSGNPYYHINWGWYNKYGYNGWWNIQGWSPGDTGYDTIVGAIFDMLPEPQITSVTATGTGDDFQVQWEVSDRLNWEEFTLEQKVDDGAWEVVASAIPTKNYTITNPTGTVYQLRVKAKVDGTYYDNSWSEKEVYAVSNWYNGYVSFEGSQHAYARQTPEEALDFTGDYTFETWIRVHGGNQDGDVILDQQNVFGFTIDEVTASDYSISFKSFSTNAELHSNQAGSKLQNEQWVHVAVSKTGNTAKLFVNGELRDSSTTGFNLSSSNNYLNMGEKYHGSYSSYIIADIDQLRISSTGRYPSAFTPNQNVHFDVDDTTVSYFTFQDVHRKRLKDNAQGLSFVVNNAPNNANWKFEENSGSLTVAEQQLFDTMLQVYPNPTMDYINVIYTENDTFNLADLSFSLFDVNGKKVSEITSITTQENQIDVTQLTTGTYFIKVSAKGFSATQKIIKQ